MKTIEVKCEVCGNTFNKLKKEINRCKKRGMKNCCSRPCAVSYRNSVMPNGYWKQQYEKQKNSFDIKSQCRNRKDEYSPFRFFINKCKSRNRDDGLDMDIDVYYLKELWKLQNGLCVYTQIKMTLPETINRFTKSHSLTRASLDRIDSSKGYIKGNVEFVCYGINLAKNNYTKNEMMSFVKNIISSQNTLSITQAKPS